MQHTLSPLAKKTEALSSLPAYGNSLRLFPLKKEDYPLIPNQIGLLYEEERLNEAVYNWQLAFEIKGNLAFSHFTTALTRLMNHHSAFRTGFDRKQNIQFIRDKVEFSTSLFLERVYEEQELFELIQREQHKAFDFSTPPLARSTLIKTAEDTYCWLFIVHHSVFDGKSQSIFLQELSGIYNALCKNLEYPLPVQKIQFGDFCYWQNSSLTRLQEGSLNAWIKYLDGYQPSHLPGSIEDGSKENNRAGRVELEISAARYMKLKELARTCETTEYVILLSVFISFLYHYVQQPDITIASVTANRNQFKEQLQNAIGYFANTFLVRSKIELDVSFIEFVNGVKADIKEYLYKHSSLPFSALAGHVVKNGESPFNIMFVMEPSGYQKLKLNGLSVKPLENLSDIARFDLAFQLREADELFSEQETSNGFLTGFFEYSRNKFNENFIVSLKEAFLYYLENVLKEPQNQLSSIEYLTFEHQEQIKKTSGESREFAKAKGIHQYFEDYAQLTPEATAIVFEDKKISYDHLNRFANQIAGYLIRKDVKPGNIVGICLPHSIEAIAALVGVLKIGGVALFLETENAQDIQILRKEKLAQTKSTTVIGLHSLTAGFSEDSSIQLILLDEHNRFPESIQNEYTENVKVMDDFSNHHAIITFTSGTTGKPKAVIANHAGMSNWSMACTRYVEKAPNIYASAPTTFDAFSWEIMCLGLANGKTVHMLPTEYRLDIARMQIFFQNNNITTATFTPTFLRLLNPDDFPTLKQLFIVGEKLPEYLIESWLKKEVNVTNGYGPSEVTVGATLYDCVLGKAVNIGKAIPNVYVYILDPITHQPLPLGVWGEIAIGGVGVTEYFANPEQTREKFIADPFFPERRVYLSGDFGRFNLDNNLECNGRIDRQIKFKGARIEPEEIEKILIQNKYVIDVFVTLRSLEGEQESLTAYIKLKTDEALPPDFVKSLTRHLENSGLPPLKAPRFCFVSHFPYTHNGKIDEKELAKFPLNTQMQEEKILPSTALEQGIAKVLAHLLGVDEQLDINSTFYRLGIDSVRVVSFKVELFKMVDKIKAENPQIKNRKVELLVSDLKTMTIKTLAVRLQTTLFESSPVFARANQQTRAVASETSSRAVRIGQVTGFSSRLTSVPPPRLESAYEELKKP